MPRFKSFFCELCYHREDSGAVTICSKCEKDASALQEVYHELIAKFPRLNALSPDKAFSLLVKRLVFLEKSIK
jgi:hypothetical protein